MGVRGQGRALCIAGAGFEPATLWEPTATRPLRGGTPSPHPGRSPGGCPDTDGVCPSIVDDPTVITPYRDGPLLVRGAFRLQDQDGNLIAANREAIALCRCGKSRSRPFCDGTHKLVGFRAPSTRESGRNGPPRG